MKNSFVNIVGLVAAAGLLALVPAAILADTTHQPLPYGPQDWSNASLITVTDDWSTCPGFIGFRGDGLASTGSDPRDVTGSQGTVDINANRTNPESFNLGGLVEYEITDPTVAIAGSLTADAPYLVLNLQTTGFAAVTVSCRIRDLEDTVDDSVSQIALQYRVGNMGPWSNPVADAADAYVADATVPNAFGPDILRSVTLDPSADDEPLVQVRWITVDAPPNDEWVGIDDISVTGSPLPEIDVLDHLSRNIANGALFRFGSIVQGAGDRERTFTVENSGGSALFTSNFNVTGAAFAPGSDPLAALIGPGSSDTFSLVFDDAALGIAFSGTVSFDNSDSDEGAYVILLDGDVTATPQPEIEVREYFHTDISDGSGPVSMGSATFGAANTTRTFTVYNTGTASMNISAIALGTGTDFHFGADPLAIGMLAAGTSDTFTVEMETDSLGTHNDAIAITSNDIDEGLFDFAIAGTINAGTTPVVRQILASADGQTLTLTFDKPMLTAGTVTPAPDSELVAATVVTLNYTTTPLSAFPVVTSLGLVNATAGDMATLSTTIDVIGRRCTVGDIRGTIDVLGLSTLEGAAGVDTDGAWVTTSDIVMETILDNVNRREVTIAGSPGIVVRGSANGTFAATNPGDHITVTGQVSSLNGLQKIVNASGGQVLVSTNSTGNSLPLPAVTTNNCNIGDFAFFEQYESQFVYLYDVHFHPAAGPGATFPAQAPGTTAIYGVCNNPGNSPILAFEVDGDVSSQPGVDGFDGKAAPIGDFNVVGLLRQFEIFSPYNDGYKIVPLSYTAILPPSEVGEWMILEE